MAGPKSGNNQADFVSIWARSHGMRCVCIRCREAGLGKDSIDSDLSLVHRTKLADSSNGREVFLS